MSSFYRSWARLGDALLPRRCVGCARAIAPYGAQYAAPHLQFVCQHCATMLQNTAKVRCRQCGLALGPRPQAFGWTHCRHCRTQDEHNTLIKPDNCVVCCDYEAPFDQWVSRLKYGQAHGLAAFFGDWLAEKTLASGLALPDVLVPVPSSAGKLQSRGYNQAALIAKRLGKRIKRPVHTNWLTKVREADAQAELNRAERLQNLEHAFQATRVIGSQITIGLVDDVITTGATLQSCMNALHKAGARHILTMAICRTPE